MPDPVFVDVYGKQYNIKDVELAWKQIEHKAGGGKGSVISPEEENARRVLTRILQYNPQAYQSYEAGMRARAEAGRLGFESVSEYQTAQQWVTTTPSAPPDPFAQPAQPAPQQNVLEKAIAFQSLSQQEKARMVWEESLKRGEPIEPKKTFLERADYYATEGFPIAEKFVELGAWVGERKSVKFVERKLGLQDWKIGKSEATAMTSEFGKLIFFSPAFTPTYQYEKLLQPSEVFFTGTTKELKSGLTRTDVRFMTGTGERGVATGVSVVKPSGEVVVGRTITFGKYGKYAMEFPTGRIKLLKQKPFFDVGKIITFGEKEGFKQISYGATKTPKDFYKYFGVGRGATKGEFTFLEGRILTERGFVKSGGIIKTITKDPTKYYSVSGEGSLVSKTYLKQIQASISGAVSQPSTISVSPAVATPLLNLRSDIKTTPSMDLKTTIPTSPTSEIKQSLKSDIKLISIQAPKDIVSAKQTIGLISVSKTKEGLKQLTPSREIFVTKMKQPLISRGIFKVSPMLKTKQDYGFGVGGIAGFPKTPTPITKGFLPLFPLFKGGRKYKKVIRVKLKPQPKKYQPTLASVSLGITAPAISKLYRAGGGGIGIRPVIVKKKGKKKTTKIIRVKKKRRKK